MDQKVAIIIAVLVLILSFLWRPGVMVPVREGYLIQPNVGITLSTEGTGSKHIIVPIRTKSKAIILRKVTFTPTDSDKFRVYYERGSPVTEEEFNAVKGQPIDVTLDLKIPSATNVSLLFESINNKPIFPRYIVPDGRGKYNEYKDSRTAYTGDDIDIFYGTGIDSSPRTNRNILNNASSRVFIAQYDIDIEELTNPFPPPPPPRPQQPPAKVPDSQIYDSLGLTPPPPQSIPPQSLVKAPDSQIYDSLGLTPSTTVKEEEEDIDYEALYTACNTRAQQAMDIVNKRPAPRTMKGWRDRATACRNALDTSKTSSGYEIEPTTITTAADFETYSSCDAAWWTSRCNRMNELDFEPGEPMIRPRDLPLNDLPPEYQPMSPEGTRRVLGPPSDENKLVLPVVSAWDNSNEV